MIILRLEGGMNVDRSREVLLESRKGRLKSVHSEQRAELCSKVGGDFFCQARQRSNLPNRSVCAPLLDLRFVSISSFDKRLSWLALDDEAVPKSSGVEEK